VSSWRIFSFFVEIYYEGRRPIITGMDKMNIPAYDQGVFKKLYLLL
jgi:hypothetical protein